MNRSVAEVFPPGDYIKDELDARGWTQSDLAEILGRSRPKINELINGKRAITIQTAKELAAAFGTSAQVWLNLETQWQLWRDQSTQDEIAKRAKRYDAQACASSEQSAADESVVGVSPRTPSPAAR